MIFGQPYEKRRGLTTKMDDKGCRLRFDLQYWWTKPRGWRTVIAQKRGYGWLGLLKMIWQDSIKRPKGF